MEWENLSTIAEGETVALKGFLIEGNQGQWVLSNDAGLKSCCVGAVGKENSQVTLLGDFSHYSSHALLKVKGTLHKTANGSFSLSDIEVAKKSHFPLWTIGTVFAICCVITAIKLKRLLLP